MILKLGLLIVFLSVTICFATSEDKKDGKYSVEEQWNNSSSSCENKPYWLYPVQKYYDDVMSAFSTFPSQVTKPANEVKTTFETFLTKVIETSNSNSTFLSSGATGILESFVNIALNIHSANGIIDEFTLRLSDLMTAYRKIVTDMTNIIGNDLVCAVNTCITDLEYEFKCYVKEFDKKERRKEVGYEPIMKRVQNLVDTIALKGDVQLEECQLEDPDVQDELVVLSLILEYIMVLVHGLSSSSEAAILEQQCVPVVIHIVIVAVGTFIHDVTESLVENIVPNATNVRKHLETLGKCASKLAETLAALFKAVAQITKQLTNTIQGVTQGLINPLRLIG